MTANHEHTPLDDLVLRMHIHFGAANTMGDDHSADDFASVIRILENMPAKIAAAEQRGRIAELREVVAEFEHQDPNDLRNNSMRDGQVWTLESCMSAHIASAPILDWLENRADRLEGDDG